MKLGFIFEFESLARPADINGFVVAYGSDIDAAAFAAMQALYPLFEFEGPDDVHVEATGESAWMV